MSDVLEGIDIRANQAQAVKSAHVKLKLQVLAQCREDCTICTVYTRSKLTRVFSSPILDSSRGQYRLLQSVESGGGVDRTERGCFKVPSVQNAQQPGVLSCA